LYPNENKTAEGSRNAVPRGVGYGTAWSESEKEDCTTLNGGGIDCWPQLKDKGFTETEIEGA
jgi:hypothetical protein